MNSVHVKNHKSNNNHNSLMIDSHCLSYLVLHLRLSTFFYMNQLVDIFAYESSSKQLTNNQNNNLNYSTIIVYNFHSIISQTRTFLFTRVASSSSYSTNPVLNSLSSIADYYPAAN